MGSKNIVCFGEVLWDMLPSGKQPGGAPMNVAYHFSRLGMRSNIISRIGNDDAGEELCAFLSRIGLSTEFIQVDDSHDTSSVLAHVGNDNEVTYDIVAPVAWDFITYEERFSGLVKQADVLVYGSLASRNPASRDTLLRLVDQARYRAFDVNLRAPHYTQETLELLLGKADMVKLNAHELAELATWYAGTSADEREQVSRLQQRYGIAEVIVTKGANGASYYTDSAQYNCPAVRVEVKDTVGSGDSFLAAFLMQKLNGESGNRILEYATALAAYVTTQSGACPIYTIADINRFVKEAYPER